MLKKVNSMIGRLKIGQLDGAAEFSWLRVVIFFIVFVKMYLTKSRYRNYLTILGISVALIIVFLTWLDVKDFIVIYHQIFSKVFQA